MSDIVGLRMNSSLRLVWRIGGQNEMGKTPQPRIALIAAAALLVFACSACAGATGAGAGSTQLPAETRPAATEVGVAGLPEADAIAVARTFLMEADRNAEVWATLSGDFVTVFNRLSQRPTYMDQPPPEGKADLPVWGVQFKVGVEICPPSGDACETRDGLRTIVIDFVTGEWVRTSTFAPAPGQELPRPKA